jgi:glycosyltransferase involved in cell wall biosynthesis
MEINQNMLSITLDRPELVKEIHSQTSIPEIICITTYPPRECGIATYSQDLVKALEKKFNHSFSIQICPIESDNERHDYEDEINYRLNTDEYESYVRLTYDINTHSTIELVLIQHEFGLFKNNEILFLEFLQNINKPIAIVFHTVLPHPNELLKNRVLQIAHAANSLIVMTQSSKKILIEEYEIDPDIITVIAHGTHLVTHSDTALLKEKYDLEGRKIIATFGLLGTGKSIETTLYALPEIVAKEPEILFLILGKTHPSVVKQDGETYRTFLENLVTELEIEDNVRFINEFLPLPILLDYLQLSDIYLFTSKDPNQAVSGTFSYAISCGCPIISTPIPHANEIVKNIGGLIIDFENSAQLATSVLQLLNDDQLRKNISSNGLHKMASTAWENTAVAHALLFNYVSKKPIPLRYNLPEINLNHLKKLTTDFGIIQFSKMNQPDIDSGYTLDDNARAMIAMCHHFEISKDKSDLVYIKIYLDFITHCLLTEGYFQNYVDEEKKFTKQNGSTNLADANGRAIWALGYFVSLARILPEDWVLEAENALKKVLVNINNIHSTRAMAFIIKGLYYRNSQNPSLQNLNIIKEFANRLVQMYRHEADDEWNWFESYLTYANSILSEALLCAWLATDDTVFRDIAKISFDFLISLTFDAKSIRVISNKSWLHREHSLLKSEIEGVKNGGEQPIDVAYTILALSKFNAVFQEEDYQNKMEISFSWFLGNNHLNQIIYNPCTGGCYDGLEENYVNLNQGAESTISYVLARLTMDQMEPNNNLIMT